MKYLIIETFPSSPHLETSMEIAMNATDVALTGGAMLTWSALPLMLIAGFITPLPYNYWRLKALGKACH